ncbi:ATPase [Bacteroides sp. 224]|uniref:ATPase n=1 Tax=Bacteroides sp. 224 TaxID=2302936 RepID=UPI0013D4193A|nr:ATPase [Bacteroides sp. 224]NDV64171.1 ATPase [Bacteroides sp. 224]
MILIADSGSSKTDWCVVKNGQLIRQVFTKGINPFYQSKEEIREEIDKSLLPRLDTNIFDYIYFYGAGCIPEKYPMIQDVLSSCFQVSKSIEINSDMLGAARGLCGDNPGIVCILGTGSNSCFYNGKEITTHVSPLGFILGDEGSGAVLGKLLISDLLKNQLSAKLKEKFLFQYNLTIPEIIEKVYRKPFPNRFLASVSPFLLENIQEEEIRTLVSNAFKAFFQRNVMQYDYPNYQVHFVGSVAFYYQRILKETAKELGIKIGSIVQSPMQGLVNITTTLSADNI